MALLDDLQFNPMFYGGTGGNLLDMIRLMGSQNDTYKPAPFGLPGPGGEDRLPANAQPTSGQNTIAVGDYQMPRIGFGSPMDAMAKMEAPAAAAPQSTASTAASDTSPAASAGDFGERLLAGFQGFANSRGLLPAIANGIAGFNNGNQTQQFLMKKGLDAQTARTVASNPTLLKSMLPQLMGTADKTTDVKNFEYGQKNPEFAKFLEASGKNGGRTEYGLNPIYGTDAQGNQVLGVLGKDGSFKRIDTGGVTPQSGVDKIDLGTQWMLRDKRTGQVVGYAPKDVAGEASAKKGGALTAERAAELPKARAGLASSFDSLDRLASEAQALRDAPGLGGITGLRGLLPNIPGGDAANAQAKLQTLKSQVGFSVLQAMREASKTGGALGNVSDAEGARLENNLAALDRAQSLDEFQKALNQIIKYAGDAKSRLSKAFKETYPGEVETTASSPGATADWQSLGGVKIRKKQ